MNLDPETTIVIKSPCVHCDGRGQFQMNTTGDLVERNACEGRGIVEEEVTLSVFLATLADGLEQFETHVTNLATRMDSLDKSLFKRLVRVEDRIASLEEGGADAY